MMPRVSVIVSIFKSKDFLFDLLKDIQRQTIFPEAEILLIDCNDESYKEDFEILSPFLSIKNFIYYKIDPCNVYHAWNIGVDCSTAPLLTNWNTDDRRAYNSLQYQVEYMEKNLDCDVCYGPTLISYIPNEIFEYCQSKEVFCALEGTLENQLQHNSPHCLPVWRKSIHERFGKFDENYFSAADYDMWFKVLKGGGSLQNLEKLIGVYYRNPIGISSSNNSFSKALDEVKQLREKYKL